jgi:hypothetical protein
VFTGFRWENRFRPLTRNYFINLVLYVELERHQRSRPKFSEGGRFRRGRYTSNAEARAEKEQALESKLILSEQHRWLEYFREFHCGEALIYNNP